MTDLLKCILAATFLLTSAACQNDARHGSFLIAPDEVWSYDRDGWEGLKLDEETKGAVRDFFGSGDGLFYRYRDSSFVVGDEGFTLKGHILPTAARKHNRQSNLSPRHYTRSTLFTLREDIAVVYVCAPDRSDAQERSASGLDLIALDSSQEEQMYTEFQAAINQWNLASPIHTKIFFFFKEGYEDTFDGTVEIQFGLPDDSENLAETDLPNVNGTTNDILFDSNDYTSAQHET